MNENKLWEKFWQNGRVSDYLEYREFVNSTAKTELDTVDKNNCTGACDTGAEHRGVR
jgi:hypothetical protein